MEITIIEIPPFVSEELTEGERPTLYIHSISNRGIVDLRFSELFSPVKNLSSINSTVISIEVNQADSDYEKLEFYWNVTEFRSDRM